MVAPTALQGIVSGEEAVRGDTVCNDHLQAKSPKRKRAPRAGLVVDQDGAFLTTVVVTEGTFRQGLPISEISKRWCRCGGNLSWGPLDCMR